MTDSLHISFFVCCAPFYSLPYVHIRKGRDQCADCMSKPHFACQTLGRGLLHRQLHLLSILPKNKFILELDHVRKYMSRL